MTLLTSTCASRHNGVRFFIFHLASRLRTRRFSEPTFRPSRATNHWKNKVFRDFPTFSRTCIFSLLTFSMYLLLPGCAFPSVHIVGSLTSKPNFLRSPCHIVYNILDRGHASIEVFGQHFWDNSHEGSGFTSFCTQFVASTFFFQHGWPETWQFAFHFFPLVEWLQIFLITFFASLEVRTVTHTTVDFVHGDVPKKVSNKVRGCTQIRCMQPINFDCIHGDVWEVQEA